MDFYFCDYLGILYFFDIDGWYYMRVVEEVVFFGFLEFWDLFGGELLFNRENVWFRMIMISIYVLCNVILGYGL